MADRHFQNKEIQNALQLLLQAELLIDETAFISLSQSNDPIKVAKAVLEKIKTMKHKPTVVSDELIKAITTTHSRPQAMPTLVEYAFESDEERKKFEKKISEPPISIFNVKEEIPLSGIPKNSTLFIASNNVSYLTHGIHEFPAKFIPQIPKWAMRKYSKELDIVLDPMCGSGTALVEARLQKRNSYGIDIEPLAQFLTKVKVTPLNEDKLIQTNHWLFQQIAKDNQENLELPEFPNRDHWFRPKVLRDLATIKRNIERIDDGDIRDFFLACFSSIIKRVSNADPEFVYALAYSKRMRQLDAQGRIIKTVDTFRATCARALPEMIKFSRKAFIEVFAKVIGDDARKINLDNNCVDLVITSPPYINAVDYVRAHKLEMYWLDLLEGKTLELQRQFIGTEKVRAEDYSKLKKFGNDKLDKVLKQIYEKDKRRSYVVYKFFMDMKKNFEEVHRVLKHNGYYVVVIGDGVIRKVPVPTHEFLVDIAKEVGFSVEDCFSYLIRGRHMKIPRQGIGGLIAVDWVMSFRK